MPNLFVTQQSVNPIREKTEKKCVVELLPWKSFSSIQAQLPPFAKKENKRPKYS